MGGSTESARRTRLRHELTRKIWRVGSRAVVGICRRLAPNPPTYRGERASPEAIRHEQSEALRSAKEPHPLSLRGPDHPRWNMAGRIGVKAVSKLYVQINPGSTSRRGEPPRYLVTGGTTGIDDSYRDASEALEESFRDETGPDPRDLTSDDPVIVYGALRSMEQTPFYDRFCKEWDTLMARGADPECVRERLIIVMKQVIDQHGSPEEHKVRGELAERYVDAFLSMMEGDDRPE